VVLQAHAGELRAVGNFHGREGVRVHIRHGLFNRPEDVTVVEGVHTTRQTALYTDLSGSHLARLDNALGNFVKGEIIGVRGAGRRAKGAERAANKADVGEVDVAIHYVSNDITDDFPAHMVGNGNQGLQVVASG